MKDRSIPIIKLHGNLLVSIQVDLDDQLALMLQDDITHEIVKTGASGLILDVSAINIMDSYIARLIDNIGKNARIMGARSVVVGLQPAIAITLVEMGMEMESVETALNLEAGLRLLDEGREEEEEEEDDIEGEES